MAGAAKDWRSVAETAATLASCQQGAFPPEACRTFLQLARGHAVRVPAVIAHCGQEVLRRATLPEDERWVVCEQTVLACLDSGDTRGADAALAMLQARFPKSLRVERLKGMAAEARGDWAGAEAIYDAILAVSPAHEGAAKRKAALLRSQGLLPACAAALVAFLDVHQADCEAWAELAEVYTELGALRPAAFCVEELLAAAPGSPLLHTQYAELVAAAGDEAGAALAAKHFAAAVELSGGCHVPALFGLLATSASTGKAHAGDLAQLAADRLRQLYAAGSAPGTAALAEAAIATFTSRKGGNKTGGAKSSEAK